MNPILFLSIFFSSSLPSASSVQKKNPISEALWTASQVWHHPKNKGGVSTCVRGTEQTHPICVNLNDFLSPLSNFSLIVLNTRVGGLYWRRSQLFSLLPLRWSFRDMQRTGWVGSAQGFIKSIKLMGHKHCRELLANPVRLREDHWKGLCRSTSWK